jgi:hypothetical protein
MFQDVVAYLSNDTFSVVDNFIVWVNLFGALAAVCFNYKASHSGLIPMRKTHFLITGLAAIYSIAYLMLLLLDLPFLQWSSVLRGVSIVVWPIVWMWPAILSVQAWNNFSKLLEFENLNYLLEQEGLEPFNHLLKDD